MTRKVIEGTWEEVLTLGGELSGHRVRVTVLDAEPEPDDGPSVFDLLQRSGILDQIARQASSEVTDLATRALSEHLPLPPRPGSKGTT